MGCANELRRHKNSGRSLSGGRVRRRVDLRRGKDNRSAVLFVLVHLDFLFHRVSMFVTPWQLLDICLQMGSKDNMTALVIKFDAQKVGDGGGVLARRQQRESEANDMNESAPPP